MITEIKLRITEILILFILVSLFMIQVLPAQTIDRIVAIVNNEIITQCDVDRVLATIEAELKSEYSNAPEELNQKLNQLRDNIVGQMIEEKLILSEAKSSQITASEDRIKARIDKIKQAFPSEQEFERVLAEQSLTLQDLRQRFRDQEIMKTAVNYFVDSKIEIQPKELESFFNSHAEEFVQPERARVKSILIKVDESGSDYRALQKAKVILRQLKKGAESNEWEDLGFIEKGQLIAEIDRAVFSLNPGEFSDVIKTESGYRIFELVQKKPQRALTFSEAQDAVRGTLYKKKFTEIFKKWMAELKQKAYIVLKEQVQNE